MTADSTAKQTLEALNDFTKWNSHKLIPCKFVFLIDKEDNCEETQTVVFDDPKLKFTVVNFNFYEHLEVFGAVNIIKNVSEDNSIEKNVYESNEEIVNAGWRLERYGILDKETIYDILE